jgi:hypothetical protein
MFGKLHEESGAHARGNMERLDVRGFASLPTDHLESLQWIARPADYPIDSK